MSWTRPFAAVERWYLDDAPLEPLAACRIGLGLAFVWFYLNAAPSHEFVWGAEGMIRYGHSPEGVRWVHTYASWLLAGTLVGSFGLMLGLFTRPMAALLIACHMLHTAQTPHFTWGWGMAAPTLVIYVALGRSHHLWSLDALIHRRRRPDAPLERTAAAWPMRLVQINVIAIYIAAAWHRIDDGAWLRGEMVFEAIAAGVFTRMPGLDVHLLPYKGWLEALCWYTWIVELVAPFLLWFRRIQPWMALLLFSVHIGLELGAFVGSWQLMMLAALMTFLKPSWLRAVVDPIARRFTRTPPPVEPGTPEPA